MPYGLAQVWIVLVNAHINAFIQIKYLIYKLKEIVEFIVFLSSLLMNASKAAKIRNRYNQVHT